MAAWLLKIFKKNGRIAGAVCMAFAVALAFGFSVGEARAQGIESVMSPGKLIKGHAKLDEECAKCHIHFDKLAQDRLCMDCHKEVAFDNKNKSGFHGKQKLDTCRTCHREHKGRDSKFVPDLDKNFDHSGKTNFALKDKHKVVDCEKCHKAGKTYRSAPHVCYSCHKKDDDEKGHKGSLGQKCEDCHTEKGWKEAKFDHDKTRFQLRNKHAESTVKCDACHKDRKFKDTPMACVACHKKADDDKGHHGTLGDKCGDCHTDKGWKETKFDHDKTKFPLKAKHAEPTVKCDACHKDAQHFKDTSRECVACHKKDDDKVHKGSLGRDCSKCHSETGWKDKGLFSHDKTSFPLRFKHAEPKVKCDSCHKKPGEFKMNPKNCYACHKKDDDEKGHKGTLGEKCEDCHSERGFKDRSKFDHDKTKFPLEGKHKDDKVKCDACHKKAGEFKVDPKNCSACHKKDDDEKGHKGSLGDKCEDCHVPQGWKETKGRFDHDKTRFPLKNAHADPKVKCDSCHKDAQHFKDTDRACYACHKKNDDDKGHQGTLGKDCAKCHTDKSWKVEKFDHNKTKFPLLGKHAVAECKGCHKDNRFHEAKSICYSCHKKEDDKQHQLKFGEDCKVCHNERDWRLWNFDHSKTKFVLDGKHTKVKCEECHRKPAPQGKKIHDVEVVCSTCHQKDDPHDGQFGSNCDKCHFTTDWKKLKMRIGRNPAMTNEGDKDSKEVKADEEFFIEKLPGK